MASSPQHSDGRVQQSTIGEDAVPVANEQADTISLGERLLPYMYAAMESCWIYSIFVVMANLHLFQLTSPIMPLWGPFLLIGGTYGCAMALYRSARRKANAAGSNIEEIGTPGTLLVFAIIVLLALFIGWFTVYRSSFMLFDPRWLLALVTDTLLLLPNGYHILGLIVFSIYFSWRGIKLTHRVLEPGDILRTLRLGMGVIIAVIILQAGATAALHTVSSFTLLLLIPIFLSLSLLAHALANAVFVRHEHVIGLEGSVVQQERSLLITIGGVCLLLLIIALLVGTMVSADMLAGLQQALSPLVQIYEQIILWIAQIMIFLATPLVALLQLLHFRTTGYKIPQGTRQAVNLKTHQPVPQSVLITASILKWALPLVLIVVAATMIWFFLRRRRRFAIRKRASDLHESIWSWELFMAQLKGLLLELWQRFFPARQHAETPDTPVEVENHYGHAARSIREIYRAMLQQVAQLGFPRQRAETPYEFHRRLRMGLPVTEPEISTLTDAYTAIRYSDMTPDEHTVEQAQQEWFRLQQKISPLQ